MAPDQSSRIRELLAHGLVLSEQALRDGPDGEIARLRRGEGTSDDIEYALAFLDLDAFSFRSGYARQRIAGYLSKHRLDAPQRARAQALVLRAVDGERHTPHPGIGRLAGAVADNTLRRALRERLQSADAGRARRALKTLLHVRRPGYTPDEVRAARQIVLAGAGRWEWLGPESYRLAARLWCPEWEAELADIARVHGPDRAGAKKLLEAMRRRHASSDEKRRKRAGL